MKKHSKLIIAVAVGILFIGTFVFLWLKSRPQEVVYSEFTPQVTDIIKSTIVTGKIEPRDEVSVKPQISGIISELMKEPGQSVSQGEVIAKVKVIPDMGQLSSAESRVRLADINLQQTERDFRRQEQLHQKQLISDDEFEKSRQQLNQAKEERAAAVDALQVVRDGVSKANASASSTLIRSTISGIILDIPVKVGNSVINSNTFNDGTTIALVANMNDLIFRGNIDETEVGRIAIGAPMKISIGALQDVVLNASLEYIAPKATEVGGANQFEVKAAILLPSDAKATQQLRSGYSATAEMVLDEARQVIAIPESAIEFQGDSTFVYVVENQGKKKSYTRRQVTTGLSDGVNIEIRKGLTTSETVRGPELISDTKD